MKKLILLFISLLALGAFFQACDDTKTYAEMLEEERDGVNDFIKKNNIEITAREIQKLKKELYTIIADRKSVV